MTQPRFSAKGKGEKENSENEKYKNFIDLIEIKHNEQIDKIEQSTQEGLQKTEKCKEEIEKIVRGIARQDTAINAELQSNTQEAKKLNIELQNIQSLIQDNLKRQLDEVKEVLQESMNLRQDLNKANTEFEKWQDFAIRFLDTMERTLEHLQNNNSPSIKDIEKVIDIFSKDVQDLGIKRIIPSRGEDFSYKFHKCVGEEEAENVNPGSVIKCNKWGYEVNGSLYKEKRAEVIVSKQIESTSEGSPDKSDGIQTDRTDSP